MAWLVAGIAGPTIAAASLGADAALLAAGVQHVSTGFQALAMAATGAVVSGALASGGGYFLGQSARHGNAVAKNFIAVLDVLGAGLGVATVYFALNARFSAPEPLPELRARDITNPSDRGAANAIADRLRRRRGPGFPALRADP